MSGNRGAVHRLARRLPGVQPLYREVRVQLALRRRVVALDHPRVRARIGVPTRSVARLRVRPVEKEPWTVAWIETHLRAGDVLWDIGANVGSYALLAALLEPGAKVVAVEPAYANYAALCENAFRNGLGERLAALPVALAARNGMGRLALADREEGAAIHELDGEERTSPAQAVIVLELDELVERLGAPAPTLAKIDVDGSEPAVLAGGARMLAREELRSVLVEIDQGNGDRVEEALAAAGLTLSERISERDGVPLPGVWYGIFER